MEKTRISLDTNVASKLLNIFRWENTGENVTLKLNEEYSSKTVRAMLYFYKLVIYGSEYELFISPLVYEELKVVGDKFLDQFVGSKLKIIELEKSYKYDELAQIYLKKDSEGKSLLKEKSKTDARIMAHSAYHGMPLITLNKSDFPVTVSKKINSINRIYFNGIGKENKTDYINKLPLKPFLLFEQFFTENKIKVNEACFQQ